MYCSYVYLLYVSSRGRQISQKSVFKFVLLRVIKVSPIGSYQNRYLRLNSTSWTTIVHNLIFHNKQFKLIKAFCYEPNLAGHSENRRLCGGLRHPKTPPHFRAVFWVWHPHIYIYIYIYICWQKDVGFTNPWVALSTVKKASDRQVDRQTGR